MGVFDISQTLFGTGGTKPPVSTSTTYGTAVSDSSDGTVNVVMDGYSVTQPSGIEETVEILADEFIDGRAELPHPAFAGTVSIVGSDGVQLLEDEFEVDGNILTIDALQGSRPVDVHYTASLELAYSSDDFESDSAELQFAPTGSITVTLDGVDVPCSYSDGQLIIEGASIQRDAAFVVEYDVPVSVTAEFDDGTCVLSDEPEAITLVGIDSQGNETEISGYELDGAIVTLTDQTEYAQYVISYTLHVTTEFNYSDTLPEQEIPEATIEDGSEEEEQEEQGGIVQLDGQPDSVSVTMDGEPFADYTLDEGTLTLNWVPEEPVTYLVSYDAVIELELATSDFSNGAYQLTAVPNGSVSTTVDDVQVANTVDGYMLSIPSLVSDVASYTVTYQAQISDGVVELPTSPSVRNGETVQVSIVSGTPVVTAVVGEGDRQDFNIDVAYTTAASAEELAEEAKAVAEATGQHFWEDDGGAHVTEVTQEEWNTSHSGANSLWNSLGMLFRNGLTNLLAIITSNTGGSATGISIYDGQGNDAENIVASFTNDGVTVGSSNKNSMSLGATSMTMLDGEGGTMLEIAPSSASSRKNLSNSFDGVMPTQGNSVTLHLATVPDLSIRSISCRWDVKVGGGSAHTLSANFTSFGTTIPFNENRYVLNVTPNSDGTVTIENISSTAVMPELSKFTFVYSGNGVAPYYRFGNGTSAITGAYGFSHGSDCYPQADNSMASGEWCVAQAPEQHVFGRCNAIDNTSALIIGNGTGSTTAERSNAMTVDWDGNAWFAGDVTDGSGNVLSGKANTSHNHAASNITSGTLGVARGGTGKSSHTVNSIITGGTTTTGALQDVATASGAFYATSANGAASFGTLPIAQGGTGKTSAADAWDALGGGSIGKKDSLVASDIPNLAASKITSGTIALARGGTATDNTARAINTVFAAPSSGSAGNASWRKLVAADIPSLNTSKLTAGTLGIARGGTGSSQVVSILANTTITVYAWGPLVMVQLHGQTGAPSANTVLHSKTLASYKPAYNASAVVGDVNGHVARLWVNASAGDICLASLGYTTSAAWYGTLVYMRVPT